MAQPAAETPPRDDAPADRPRLGVPLPLRVAFSGSRARDLLGPGVETVEAGEEGPLDALVVGHDAGISAQDREAATARARERGAVVIDLREAGIAPPVNVRTFNPLGFQAAGVAGYLAAVRPGAVAGGIAAAMPLLAEVARQDPVSLRAPLDVRAGLDFPPGVAPGGELNGTPAEVMEVVRKRLGIIDHPSFHPSDLERAGWIARLSAAGAPVVVAEPSAQLRELLGEDLWSLLEGVSPRELADLDARERHSVALRRAALRHHSTDAAWRRICTAEGIELPERSMVSVILATRRQEWLEHGLAQVARQTYEPMEVIVALHGDGFSADVEDQVRSRIPPPVKIVRVADELTLGDALNAGVEIAEGELVTKMDDDDYYNTEHLWDLELAFEYSGADLVGKAAEFVYLEEIDVTIRQITSDAETRLAGGGLMVRRAPLVELNGWPLRTRGEDLALIRRFQNNGRVIHRIPPHGYILNRHGRGHTWRPGVDYFLFRSERQWRGLRFDATSID